MIKKLPMALASIVVLCTAIASPVSASQYTYSYDQNNRLTQIAKDGVAYEDLIYDDNGNLVKVQKISPVTVSDSKTTTSSVVLTWTAAPNATKYTISQNGTKIGESTTTSYTVTGLTSTSTTSYTFAVAAVYPSGATGLPGAFTPLSAPQSPHGTSTTDSVTLTWDPVSGASGYKVFVGTDPNPQISSTTSATISNLQPGDSIPFTIVAYNDQGQGLGSTITIATQSSTGTGGGGTGGFNGGGSCGDVICSSVTKIHKNSNPFSSFTSWVSNYWTRHF